MAQTKNSIFSLTCDRLNQHIKKKKTFPEYAGLNFNTSSQDLDPTLDLFPATEENKSCTTKPKMKQLTILYNGEAVNFENIEAVKAGELIAFASSIAASCTKSDISMPMARTSLQRFLERRKARINSNAPYSSSSSSSSDISMPMARTSLQRFLERRKVRINSNATSSSSSSSSLSKRASYDDKPWLQLAL